MAQAQEAEKHVIWSNMDLDLEDWKPGLEENYPDMTDDEYYGLMHEINDMYFDDERANLDIQLGMPIIVCADLGLWNGRRMGYKMIDSGNIRDCLFGDGDFSEWFVDRKGDLRCTSVHHDGTNHYLYRAVRERVPDWRVERLQEKLYNGTADDADIERVTRRLGDEIAAVYGFPIPEEKKEKGGIEAVETVDAQKEVFEEVELLGRTGYFTEMRVDRETVPEGMFCYELRHGDDDSFPASMEENVRMNYFGTVILTEELALGEGNALRLDYGDFGYTGEQIYLSQAMEGREPEPFGDARELEEFCGETFPITEEEGRTLMEYMEGHGYLLGRKDGELFRGDLCFGQGEVAWEPYAMDDAVNAAAEWNFEQVRDAEAALDMADTEDVAELQSRLDDLRKAERVLDGLFDRTKYGKEIDGLAVRLAENLIADMDREGGIDAAIGKMAEQIKEGVDLLPDVSPALKKDGGRKR